MARFALLLPHAPDRYTNFTEDENMAIIADYIAWVEDLETKGIYDGGYKLVDAPGRTLINSGDEVSLHDGPYAEIAEILGGIMVINAKDLDEAVAIARTNPHVKHNRRLEIREVHDV